jgi:hypothetical protein
MANCLVVPHVVPEPAWAIGDALSRVGIGADVRRTFAADPIPLDASGHAGVVVMGGPMSACSDDGFPSWRAEVALLAEALVCAAPTLGVRLGAQLGMQFHLEVTPAVAPFPRSRPSLPGLTPSSTGPPRWSPPEPARRHPMDLVTVSRAFLNREL